MNKIIKFATKYWTILSICATIIGSLVTWSTHLKNRIDKDEDTLAATNKWVSDHDDAIQSLHDEVIRLKALEEARDRI